MTFSKILKALNDLTPVQLLQVRTRAKFLADRHSDKEGASTDLERLYSALAYSAEVRVNGFKAPNLAVWKKGNKHWKLLKEHYPTVAQFVDTYFGDNITIVERITLYRVFGDMIASDILSWSEPIPLSMNVMIGNITRVPALFEASFPGYLHSGLGPMVLRAHSGYAPPVEDA